ncbi:hypothetical protein PRZ48_013877 [Zasmidium cellare]|uniref:Heterokaryon incompatibility domain-containing protein n=1 Tax=Zasmidium cellare TaxID=395010 RepID=A0ABR0E2B4_ZASCE|nr:hypothetical protein PRZ48_013877 [Zasmidium cellare]
MPLAMENPLCRSCHGCLEGTARLIDLNEVKFAAHHETPEDFAAAVQEGCAICRELWKKSNASNSSTESCSADMWQGWDVQSSQAPFTCFRITHFNMDLYGMYIKMADGATGPKLRSLYRVLVLSEVMPPSEHFRKVSQSPDSESTMSHTGDAGVMSQLLGWMEQCKSHPRCSSNASPRSLPTRLVDLSPPEGNETFRVWTTDSSLEYPPPAYCTLSHCWGDGKGVLKLEKSTLASLYAGRKKLALPLSFREAMTVALELGIRHMWIDSLCIIQDDVSDWETESQSMSRTYANAQCNIAATANPHAHMRLFRDRSLDDVKPLQVSVSAQLHESVGIKTGKYSLYDVQLWSSNVKDQPLNTRAWVFQERLLSPRVIHFTKDQVIWQCISITASEAYPGGVPWALWQHSGEAWFHRQPSETSWLWQGPCQSLPSCQVCTQWALLVQRYSQGNLTFPNDRPVAVVGLARQVAQQIQDVYIWGMFKNHLLRQLCWIDLGLQGKTLIRQSNRDLPSFSWLSVDGEIRTSDWKMDVHGWHCDIVRFRGKGQGTVADNAEPSRLEVRGSLIPMHVQKRIINLAVPDRTELLACLITSGIHVFLDVSRREGVSMVQGVKHYLLPLGGETDSANRRSVACLLVELVAGSDPAYRRVGYVDIVEKDFGESEPAERFRSLQAKYRLKDNILLV